jgi:tetratricopeptide (TPR) repeat protein
VSDRLTRHEIKEDALVTSAFRSWDWAQQNLKIVLGVLGGIILLIGGLVFVQRANARAEAEAGRILAEASTNYWQGSYPRTIQLADQVIEGFGSTRAATDARRMKADALFWEGSFDTAATLYREVLDRDKRDSPVRAAVKQSLAYALESAKKPAEAAKLYQELADDAPNRAIAADLYMAAARSYAAANQIDLAKKTYTKVATEYKETNFSREADIALGELMAQSPPAAP